MRPRRATACKHVSAQMASRGQSREQSRGQLRSNQGSNQGGHQVAIKWAINAPGLSRGSYVAMNTIKATSKCNKKGQIKFTQMLGKISTINKNKREKIDYNKVKLFEDKTVTKKINKNKKK